MVHCLVMANWGSGPATPGAPSRFALSGRTSHRGCREVSGDWRTWVLWFNVPAQSRRVAVAMPVPLGCRLRHRGAIREPPWSLVAIELVRSVQVLEVREAGSRGGPQIPATVASWSARPRTRQPSKGSAPRHRSLLSSLNSIEPGSLPSEPCDPDVPNARRPGICLTCSSAASSMMVARVRGTAPYAWFTVSCMVSSFRFGGGMGSRPRRAHSRLGGAAVVTGSGEVAPKLHGLSGPRRITPLSCGLDGDAGLGRSLEGRP
jgi:hypothetical protein